MDRIGWCHEIERLQIDIENGRRLITVNILKRDDEVGWKNRGGICISKDVGLPLNRLLTPETSFPVDLLRVFCTPESA
jgi:hypothetical protein